MEPPLGFRYHERAGGAAEVLIELECIWQKFCLTFTNYAKEFLLKTNATLRQGESKRYTSD